MCNATKSVTTEVRSKFIRIPGVSGKVHVSQCLISEIFGKLAQSTASTTSGTRT